MEFIFGEESYFIAKRLKEIKDSFSGEIITMDDESTLEQIYNEVFTHSIFSEDKLIIFKNITALSKDSSAEEFMTALKNTPDSGVETVFVFEGVPNKKNSLVKYLFNNAEINKMNKLSENEVSSTIAKIVRSKGGSIKYSTAVNLSLKLPNNLRLIIQEVEKLIKESKDVTDEMVEKSIGDYGNENFFALSNAITSGNINQILSVYKERIKDGDDPLSILSQMAFVYNLVYKVKTLEKLGYSESNIATKLKIHPFRIKKALEIYFSTSEKTLDKFIGNLADLEREIKSGKIDPKIGLDNLILNLLRH